VAAPFIDTLSPAYDADIHGAHCAARKRSWYAHTPQGLILLRYEDVHWLLRDARFREQGTDALVGMLDSSDTYASEQAVLMLQESGVLDTLISQLDSKEKETRDRSLFVLARMVDLRRTHLLTDMADRHPDERIRHLLTMMLGLPETPATEAVR